MFRYILSTLTTDILYKCIHKTAILLGIEKVLCTLPGVIAPAQVCVLVPVYVVDVSVTAIEENKDFKKCNNYAENLLGKKFLMGNFDLQKNKNS